jgi:hypothetical protein
LHEKSGTSHIDPAAGCNRRGGADAIVESDESKSDDDYDDHQHITNHIW